MERTTALSEEVVSLLRFFLHLRVPQKDTHRTFDPSVLAQACHPSHDLSESRQALPLNRLPSRWQP